MKARKNALEWAVFGVSLVIFIAIVALLVIDAIGGGVRAPQISVQAGEPDRQGELWAVPLTISNGGDETAEEVRIEIALQKDGVDVEVAEVTVTFVPRNSSREAWTLFRTDPRDLQIVPRGIAFERP